MNKAQKRAYNRTWMRRKRIGYGTQRKYVKRGMVGWNNLFKVERRANGSTMRDV